jgi:hypothetical protein
MHIEQEVRRDESATFDLADPLLRHKAGSFFLDRRLYGRRKDLVKE